MVTFAVWGGPLAIFFLVFLSVVFYFRRMLRVRESLRGWRCVGCRVGCGQVDLVDHVGV